MFPSSSECECVYLCVCVCSPGFQVVGGENSGRVDLGTFISSITPGGPADVNGSIKPGRPLGRDLPTPKCFKLGSFRGFLTFFPMCGGLK